MILDAETRQALREAVSAEQRRRYFREARLLGQEPRSRASRQQSWGDYYYRHREAILARRKARRAQAA